MVRNRDRARTKDRLCLVRNLGQAATRNRVSRMEEKTFMKKMRSYYLLALLLLPACAIWAQKGAQVRIVVDLDGKGQFRSIQQAVNSLPDTSAVLRVIHIRPGT